MNRASVHKPIGPSARWALLGLSVAILSGCASQMSAVGGDTRYACSAPTGSQCTSVSGVYANGLHGPTVAPTPGWLEQAASSPAPAREGAQEAPAESRSAQSQGSEVTSYAKVEVLTEGKSEPLRQPPRVLRLWVAPWEDTDGDLHEASTVHVLVDIGRWRIEHVRPMNGASRMGADAVKAPMSPAPQR